MRPRTLSQHHLRIHAAYSSTLGVDLGMLNYSKSSKRGPSGVLEGGKTCWPSDVCRRSNVRAQTGKNLQTNVFNAGFFFACENSYTKSVGNTTFWFLGHSLLFGISLFLMNILRLSISRHCITSLSMWFQRALPRRFGDDVGVTVLRAIDITHSYTGICARDAGSTRPWTTTRKMQP